jgi:two-component system, LytTR family, response regulator
MITAILIDDELSVLDALKLLITKYVPDVEILACTEDPSEGVRLINQLKPELVFLDINMPGMDGFDVLQNATYRHFHLVFTTAHQEHALHAIKEEALDYLLKPVDIRDLEDVVERVKKKRLENPVDAIGELAKLADKFDRRIALPMKKEIMYVASREILYIEAMEKQSRVTLKDGRGLTVSRPLKDFENELHDAERSFIRISSSFLVNMNYAIRIVRSDGGHIVMQNGKCISISKTKKQQVLNYYGLG